jgi:hypothetical protein
MVLEDACRTTSGCTSRGTELKLTYAVFSVINACPAGDPQCYTDLVVKAKNAP